ncbi:hypothetical protein [Streptomyces sp. NBC_01727]|nr:hypothetical protein OIE76_41055 [Streptomyces sp. NBC_01727]
MRRSGTKAGAAAHGPELITTVPRVTRKEVVVRKSGEHNRRKIV